MQELGRHLCDLFREAIEAEDPGASLRIIAALRHDLEAFERAQVARALDRGSSFGDVARALGISRQAAHRRYRDLPDEPEGSGRILVTSEARAVVGLARQEASALGASTVGTEHLLLGILRFDEANLANQLDRFGVDLRAARANAHTTLVNGSLDGVPPGPKGISERARAVFEQSLREAVRRGDGYIGVEHLLIATVRDEDGGAHRTLEALGVDPSKLIARL
jgi:hypothetical protein